MLQFEYVCNLHCLKIRISKTITFSFGTNGKLIVYGNPILKPFRITSDSGMSYFK